MTRCLCALLAAALLVGTFGAVGTGCGGAQVVEQPREPVDPLILMGAIHRASGLIHQASAEEGLFERAFRVALADGYRQRARDVVYIWADAVNERGVVDHLTAYLDAGYRGRSIENVLWDCVTETEASRDLCRDLLYDFFEADEEFLPPEVLTLEMDNHFNGLQRITGSSSLIFKIRLNGETIAAFKPMQELDSMSYRAEIAAYRLCRLIRCNLDIPHNREVRLSEADFLTATGIESADGTAVNRLGELIWFTDDDGTRWLHGTMKAWIPGFTDFPLEFTDVWSYLVDGSMTRQQLASLRIDDVLAPLAGFHYGNHEDVMARAADMTALGLAAQLSDLHTFDLLLNNWDRYRNTERHYGSNCQFNNGVFVSLDNAAAFQTDEQRAYVVTRRLFRQISLFSPRLVDAIRNLDEDRAFRILFPESEHFDERANYEYFLERRQVVLDQVDALIEDRGADAVLVLP